MRIARQKNYLIVPRNVLDRIDGNRRRRISMVITNPRSRHIILTRFPETHNLWYNTTLERETDFIPTHVLQKAKIDKDRKFDIKITEGEVIISRAPHKRR